MKKFISYLLVGVLATLFLVGCDSKKLKLPDSSKYDVKKDQTTQENKKIVPSGNKPTSLYEGTTKFNGTSKLEKRPLTVTYEQNGQVKSEKVTVIVGFEDEMLAYVNNLRNIGHKNALKNNDELRKAAIIRASEAAVCWSHTRPNGQRCFTVLDTLSIRPQLLNAGENLGRGQKSVPQVMKGWMGSKTHKENILSSTNEYTDVGFAWIVTEDGTNYWAQIFAYVDEQ